MGELRFTPPLYAEELTGQHHYMPPNFNNLPSIIIGLERDNAIPPHLHGSIRVIDNDFQQLEDLLTTCAEKDTEDFKIAILFRHQGHVTPLIIEKKLLEDGSTRINVYNTDSRAFEDVEGGDELKEGLKTSIEKVNTSTGPRVDVNLYAIGLISDNAHTCRQYQEGACVSFSLSDILMMLSSQESIKFIEEHSSKMEGTSCIYNIDCLPPHLVLFTQSFDNVERWGLTQYMYANPIQAETHITFNEGSKLFDNLLTIRNLIQLFSRTDSPITFFKKEIDQSKPYVDLNDQVLSISTLRKIIEQYRSDFRNVSIQLLINLYGELSSKYIAFSTPALVDAAGLLKKNVLFDIAVKQYYEFEESSEVEKDSDEPELVLSEDGSDKELAAILPKRDLLVAVQLIQLACTSRRECGERPTTQGSEEISSPDGHPTLSQPTA